MKINLDEVKLVRAEKNNEIHKKEILNVFNENIEFFFLTSKPISYESHCKWWETAYENEYIYVIFYQSEICGYYRLNKEKNNNKEKNEVSVAILKRFQGFGLGNRSYYLFEKEMEKIGISELIFKIKFDNKRMQNFLQKNKFIIQQTNTEKSVIRFVKKLKNKFIN